MAQTKLALLSVSRSLISRRLLPAFASGVAALAMSTASASAASHTTNFTAPAANASLPQVTVPTSGSTSYDSGAVIVTDCQETATQSQWSITSPTAGALASGTISSLAVAPQAVTSGGKTFAGAKITATVSSGARVENLPITVQYAGSGANGNGSCASAPVSLTVRLPLVYSYSAGAFGVHPTQVAAFNGTSKQIYIADQGTGSNGAVYKIASAAQNPPAGTSAVSVVSPFSGLTSPGALALLTGGTPGAAPTNVVATNFYGGAAALAWTSATALPSLTGCVHAAGVSGSQDEVHIFVACASGKVFQINPSTGAVDGAYSLPLANAAPAGVAYVPASGDSRKSEIVVGDAQNDMLYLLKAGASGNPPTLDATIPTALTGCVPASIVPGPASSTPGATVSVYVACPGTGTVKQVTIQQTAGVNSFGASPTSYATSASTSRPFGVAVDSAASTIVVTESATQKVDVIDPSGAKPTITLSVAGATPAGVGILPGIGNTGSAVSLAYIANEANGSVTVVDPPTLTGRKKAHKARSHRIRRHTRHHGRHKPAKAALASALARNIALLRSRAHTLPLTPPIGN